jgi:hypothetical protein
MTSILKVDTIQDQAGNNIINESSDTITIGASGDTVTIPSGATSSILPAAPVSLSIQLLEIPIQEYVLPSRRHNRIC